MYGDIQFYLWRYKGLGYYSKQNKRASPLFLSLCPNNRLPLLRWNVVFCLGWYLFQCMHIDNAECNGKTPWAEFKLKETKHQSYLHSPQQHAKIKSTAVLGWRHIKPISCLMIVSSICNNLLTLRHHTCCTTRVICTHKKSLLIHQLCIKIEQINNL